MARAKAAPDELDDLDLEEDFEVEEEEETKAQKKGKGASKTKSEKPKGIGARQLADHLQAEPKTFRAWLRRKVEAGDIVLDEREAKSRYNFGASLESPLCKRIIKAWNEDSHDRNAGLEKAQQARKQKEAAKPKTTKKA